MRNATVRLTTLSILSFMATAAAAQTANEATENAAADLVATQVREQGYTCEDPTKAERDPTELDDAVWQLNCKNASYRVRLVPDMAAQIEQID